MALFLPTVAVERVTDITPQLLFSIQASGILLDVDNTLSVHGSQEPFEGTVEWVRSMKLAGIKMIVISNNSKKRVAPFVLKYDLPFLSLSCKPLPFAYFHAAKKLNLKRKDVVVVGDQIFTDVIGANFSFMKSILLTPIEEETGISFRIKRKLETMFRKRIIKKGLTPTGILNKDKNNKE